MLIGLQMSSADAASGRRLRAAAEALARLPGVEGVNLQFRRGSAVEFPVLAIDELGLDTHAIGRTDVDDITRPAPGPILTAGIDMFAVSTAWSAAEL